ncbi:hypothetical protein NA8A_14694 [Nitratireductor indicus C115]|uniref:Uncharacterized protein n=1 Tax=Nitratireductor indicus C115 TaxID=1231190 RepID=K2NVK0_9HYPH|nr:hypothetical protein NA8A_14694 [Nitratireductor indicus C115]
MLLRHSDRFKIIYALDIRPRYPSIICQLLHRRNDGALSERNQPMRQIAPGFRFFNNLIAQQTIGSKSLPDYTLHVHLPDL